jgi:hypothetical protein
VIKRGEKLSLMCKKVTFSSENCKLRVSKNIMLSFLKKFQFKKPPQSKLFQNKILKNNPKEGYL